MKKIYQQNMSGPFRIASATFFFLLFRLINASAEDTTYSKKITVKLENGTIFELFEQIQSQSEYLLFYNDRLLSEDQVKNVTIEFKNAEVDKILDKVLPERGLTYKVSGRQIAIIAKETVPKAKTLKKETDQPDISIRGKITDENGEPMPGVSIQVKGKGRGTISDIDGNFSLSAASDGVLIISFIGYKKEEIAINGQTLISFKMMPSITELSQVVVTGVFERQAESFTGSAVTVTQDELKRVGNANLIQTLRNVDPSLIVVDNFSMGSNPNAMPEMQIRGTSTFPAEAGGSEGLRGNYLKNPNQPLFILNGFETSIEQVFDLDINRVESVTILKDAASKAIYGARAANGVIVIETKRLTGSQTIVTYNGSVDIDMPDLTSYNLANSLEKLEAERLDGMYINASPDGYIRLQQLYNNRRKLALEGLDTYWMAKPLQTGIGQRHAVSVELGSEDLRILGNVSYRDQVGVMKGSSRTNIGGNLTALYRVKKFSFRNITSINSNSSTESPYGTFDEYSRMNPYWRAENADGSIPYYAEIGPNGERYTNPLYNSTLNSKNTAEYLNFTNNFYLEYNILPELRAIARFGIDIKNNTADEFLPSNHTRFENFYGEEATRRKGSYKLNNGESSFISADLNFNYSKEINKHFYFANLGFNISENKFNEVIHLVEGFPSNRMDNIIFGRAYALDARPVGIDGISRDLGVMAVGSYMYDNRFLSDITLRRSASSQFGADKRWAEFWSLGLGWNVHNESFLKGGAVDQFRIRGSVGSTGNQNFNTNSSIATYNYYLESLYQGFTGSYLMNMPNPSLQWEEKFDYNLGLDVRIKNVTLRFDYYENYTEQLISNFTIPSSTGFNSVKNNIGKVRNAGIDLNTSYMVWSKDRNFLSLNFGVVTNKNEIVDLSEAMRSFNAAAEEIAAERGNSKPIHKYQDGMSMDAIWAVPSLGIDPATGKEIFIDRNGEYTYIWDARDMVVAGNSNPAYRGNFGFNGEYKGIGVSVTFRYLAGGQMYNHTLVDRVENVDMNYNVDSRVLTGRWLQAGDQVLFKRLGTYTIDTGEGTVTSHPEKTRATSRFVQDRNDLDIAAVNVYYDFNPKLIENLGISRLKMAFNMNEVATISSIRIERGTSYPFARTMSFSLLATF